MEHRHQLSRHSRNAIGSILLGGAAVLAAGLVIRATLRQRRFFDLRGKVALVTGGSRGAGYAIAQELLRRGARVAICARAIDELNTARDRLASETGGVVMAFQADVTDLDRLPQLIEDVTRALGPIEVLVNNAGIISVGPMEHQSLQDYQSAINTHFQGPVHLTLAVLPGMKQRGRGRIVNVTSIGGKVPTPHLVPYSASKYALVGFSESLRTELAKDNVFVTTVVPGLMRTGGWRHAETRGQHLKEHAWFSAADVAPVITVGVQRMARRIVDSLVHGDAELITPWIAKVQAKMHGLFPGMTSELASLMNWLLPSPRPQQDLSRAAASH